MSSLRKLAAVSTISLLVLSVVMPTSSAAGSPRPRLIPNEVGPGPVRLQSAAPVPSGWLAAMNHYRALAGLPPVTENATLSANDRAHAKWMVKNQTVEHGETPGTPFYTPEGDNAGENSNIMSGSYGSTDRSSIEGWITAPFHAVGVLDPRLGQSGYGDYQERRTSGFQYAAALDVLNGLAPNPPAGTTFPIKFPGPNTTIYLDRYPGFESPDPLTTCAGYTAPTGTPVYLQLAAFAAVTAHSFKQGTTALGHCVFDASSYPDGTTENAVLKARNAIVLLPRSPLKSNKTYEVSITAGGTTTTWSFTVGDVTPPTSKITKPTHLTVVDQDTFGALKGTSSAGTAVVEVALAQFLKSGKCKFKTASGFSTARSCGNTFWLKATGKANWARSLGSKLPASTPSNSPIQNYLMWSRSADTVGNVERTFKWGRNNVGFHVKP